MNTGKVFHDKDDGSYKFIARLGDGPPQLKRFPSFAAARNGLGSVIPFDELDAFCARCLQSEGKLEQLPGRTEDWAVYLGQG
jgi:hypothetical protein